MSNVAAGKDTDDEGEALNDVERTLNRMGIALRSAQGEWRSFEDVLDEVAAKWKDGTFTDVEKSQIATAIAGVRQQENFRALMNNWSEVERLVNVAADSTGSASKRMETYLDSIEAKTNKLKASWENFVMSLNQNESWGELLDMLSNFLDITVLTIFASLAAATKIIGALGTAITAIKAAITAGGAIAGVISAASGLLPVLLAIAGVVAAIAVGWQSVNDSLMPVL